MNSTHEQFHPRWWTTFFNGLVVEVQKKMSNPGQTQEEALFIEKMLDLPKGSVIADIPCGDGRLSIALSKLGYNLRGIDISSGIIGVATQLVAAAKVSVSLSTGDMQSLPWNAELDGVFCFGNSFAYFDDAGNCNFLREVARALKPDGRFILQTNLIAESILSRPLARGWYPFEDMLFLHAPAYDSEFAVLTSKYILIHGNDREEKEAYYRVYQLKEVLEMMKRAGFRRAKVYGGLNAEPFKPGDPSVFIVSNK